MKVEFNLIIIQVMILRSKENSSEILVVGNTHLYFRPDACHIRLLQGYYAITYIHEVANTTREEVSISFPRKVLKYFDGN